MPVIRRARKMRPRVTGKTVKTAVIPLVLSEYVWITPKIYEPIPKRIGEVIIRMTVYNDKYVISSLRIMEIITTTNTIENMNAARKYTALSTICLLINVNNALIGFLLYVDDSPCRRG
jgi:hypothetical protein